MIDEDYPSAANNTVTAYLDNLEVRGYKENEGGGGKPIGAEMMHAVAENDDKNALFRFISSADGISGRSSDAVAP